MVYDFNVNDGFKKIYNGYKWLMDLVNALEL